jgi:hypothetical protein
LVVVEVEEVEEVEVVEGAAEGRLPRHRHAMQEL